MKKFIRLTEGPDSDKFNDPIARQNARIVRKIENEVSNLDKHENAPLSFFDKAAETVSSKAIPLTRTINQKLSPYVGDKIQSGITKAGNFVKDVIGPTDVDRQNLAKIVKDLEKEYYEAKARKQDPRYIHDPLYKSRQDEEVERIKKNLEDRMNLFAGEIGRKEIARDKLKKAGKIGGSVVGAALAAGIVKGILDSKKTKWKEEGCKEITDPIKRVKCEAFVRKEKIAALVSAQSRCRGDKDCINLIQKKIDSI